MTQHLTLPLPPSIRVGRTDYPLLRTLSPNGRVHHMTRNRVRKAVEALVAVTVSIQGVQPQPTPCVLSAVWVFPQQRRRDMDNMTALLKPWVDSLVRCGILPDDSLAQLTLAPVQVVVEPGVRELRITLEDA